MLVCEQLQAGFDKAKKRYDCRVKIATFGVGDFVWYFIPRIRQGLKWKWQLANRGPCRIIRKINDVNFVIKKGPRTREEIVHIDKLSRYHRKVPPQWRHEVAREEQRAENVETAVKERINEDDKDSGMLESVERPTSVATEFK